MANQADSRDGIPRKDGDRPSPDVGGNEKRPTLTLPKGEEKGAARSGDPGSSDDRGEGPGKMGLASDKQPDLVAPSGVNQRDHGAADDKPMGGGSVNLDDDDMVHPRGKVTGAGGTRDAKGGDSAPLGPPGAGLSDRNGPSDPDNKKQ